MKNAVEIIVALLILVVLIIGGNLMIDQVKENRKPKIEVVGTIQEPGLTVRTYQLKTPEMTCTILVTQSGSYITSQPVCK